MTDAREPLRDLTELLAAVCDQTASLEDLRRIESLAGDAEGIDYVVDYLQLDGLLRWECGLGTGKEGSPAGLQSSEDAADSRRGTAEAVEGSAAGAQGLASADQQPEMIRHPQLTPAPSPLIPPIVIHASDAVPTVFSFSMSHLGGWLFSYGAATVIVGMAILGAWVYRVSHDYRIAGPSSRSAVTDVAVREKQPGLVGQITGMTDCRWATPPVTPIDAGVSLGCKYVLTSGLLEITYQTGAKVILQGPVAYEVDSTSGGFLSLGKLTARVETKGEGGRGKAGEGDVGAAVELPHQLGAEKSPFPLPPFPFIVRTPTAVVTDLGTEFGVEVDKSGATRAHVFCGRVELQVGDAGKSTPRTIPLGEDASASVEAGLAHVVKVTHAAAEGAGPNGFTRQMPKWVRIKLFNTGAGLKAGDADPHWQLVARSDDPDFKPRPAVVAARTPSYIIDDPAQSQWISAVGDLTPLPDDVTYTFRTTFDLTGTLPGTAVLRGRFLVDDRVDAVRLNGRNLDVPENGYSSLPLKPYEFRAAEGFVEGTNVLEIDVFNGIPFNAFRSSSPMGCRVELEGSVFCAPATTSDGPRPTDRKSVEPAPQRRSGKPSQGKEVSR